MQHVLGRRGADRVSVAKPEGKEPLWRPRRKYEYNIKTDIQEMGWGVDCIELAQDRYRCWAVV